MCTTDRHHRIHAVNKAEQNTLVSKAVIYGKTEQSTFTPHGDRACTPTQQVHRYMYAEQGARNALTAGMGGALPAGPPGQVVQIVGNAVLPHKALAARLDLCHLRP